MESLHSAIRLDVYTTTAGATELAFKKGAQRVPFEVIQTYVDEKLDELRMAQDRVLQSLTFFRNQDSRLKKYEIMGRQVTCHDELLKAEVENFNEAFDYRKTFQTALTTALNLASLTSNIFREFQLAKQRLKGMPDYRLYEAKVCRWFADAAALHTSVAERVKQENKSTLTVEWKLSQNGGGCLTPLQRMMLKDAATRPARVELEVKMLDLQDLDPADEEGLWVDDPPAFDEEEEDVVGKAVARGRTESASSSRSLLPRLMAERREVQEVVEPLSPALRESAAANVRGGGGLPSNKGKGKTPAVARMHASRFTHSPTFV